MQKIPYMLVVGDKEMEQNGRRFNAYALVKTPGPHAFGEFSGKGSAGYSG